MNDQPIIAEPPTVKEAVVEKFKLDPNKFNVAGKGWDEPADPRDPALAPDNIWSSRRLRRRHDAARKEEKEAVREYTATPRRFAILSTLTGGAGFVILAATLTALVWYFLRKPDKAVAASAGTDPGEKWQGAVPSEALDGFLNATTHAERMRWVRSPELVEPLVAAFYTTGPGSREKVSLTASLPLVGSDSDQQPAQEIARYGVLMEDNSKRLLSIVATPVGARVDFHSYSRHSSAHWPDLSSSRWWPRRSAPRWPTCSRDSSTRAPGSARCPAAPAAISCCWAPASC